jgi:hypothetical protein
MTMNIHNQYPDIELVSPVYFCVGGTYYEYPVEETNKDTVMKFDFRFDPDKDESGSILMYEIRRKEHVVSDHQSSIDTIYTKVVEEIPRPMRLLLIWKIKHLEDEEPNLSVVLVEHDTELVLNEDKLALLYENVNYIPTNYFRSTWLICDNMVLAERHDVLWHTYLDLKVTISKGFGNKDAIRSIWIDSERQVLFLII